MSLIHGSHGLIYFVHQFKPTFDEHALLDDPEMLAAVTALNGQIQSLAGVLHSPSKSGLAEVKSSSPSVPIDMMVKQDNSTLYLFAVGMRNGSAKGSFTVGSRVTGNAEVLGENRTIPVVKGEFSDEFKPYEPHIYAIRQKKIVVSKSSKVARCASPRIATVPIGTTPTALGMKRASPSSTSMASAWVSMASASPAASP